MGGEHNEPKHGKNCNFGVKVIFASPEAKINVFWELIHYGIVMGHRRERIIFSKIPIVFSLFDI